jgi:hypothetical protein
MSRMIEGYCADCGRPCHRLDTYIVRSEIWREAGMGPIVFGSGFLHRECLEARIGRKLTEDDLLAWQESDGKNVQINYHPDYLNSPEFHVF